MRVERDGQDGGRAEQDGGGAAGPGRGGRGDAGGAIGLRPGSLRAEGPGGDHPRGEGLAAREGGPGTLRRGRTGREGGRGGGRGGEEGRGRLTPQQLEHRVTQHTVNNQILAAYPSGG